MPKTDPDALDLVTRRIQGSSVTDDDVERAMSNLLTQVPQPAAAKRRTINGSHRGPMIAVAVVLLVALAFVLWPVVGSQSLFAQVQAQVDRTRTAQFVYLLNGDGMRREIRRMENVLSEIALASNSADSEPAAKLKSLDLKALEERVTQRLAMFREQARLGQPVESEIVQILGSSRQRTESNGIHGRQISIFNAATGDAITLFPDEQRCLVFGKKKSTKKDEQNGATDARPDPDLYAELATIDTTTIVQEGERSVDGEKLVGFHKVADDGRGLWTHSYWVNPDTKLPRLIETTWRSRDGTVATWTRAKIEFGLQLDESNFSTDPPAGYAVSPGKYVNAEGTKPAE